MKYISFVEVKRESSARTKVYNVVDREDKVIGKILWFWKWRQYVFEPKPDTTWSRECLKQVFDFIENLMVDRKVKRFLHEPQ